VLWCAELAAFEAEDAQDPLNDPELDPLFVLYDDTPVAFEPDEIPADIPDLLEYTEVPGVLELLDVVCVLVTCD